MSLSTFANAFIMQHSQRTYVWQMGVGVRILLTSCCLWLLFAANFTRAQESNIASSFRSANDAFASKDFTNAERLYREVAKQCPESELCIQCEYFAAMAAWNASPNANSAKLVTDWLSKARSFSDRLDRQGKKWSSKNWAQWTEAAHLILSKWEISQGDVGRAQWRLETLVGFHSSTNSTLAARSDQENLETSKLLTETQLWPKDFVCSANSWLQLGFVMLDTSRSPANAPQEPRTDDESALHCFEKALQSCGQDKPLKNQAFWGAANACVLRSQWKEAQEYLDQIDPTLLTDELKIKVGLLQSQLFKHSASIPDAVRTLQPLVELALAGNIPAKTIYDLALQLLEMGQNEDAERLLLQITYREPANPISIEARVRLARSAAVRKDWEVTKGHCEEIMRGSCPESLHGMVRYLLGKSLYLTGSKERGIGELELALQSVGNDIEFEIAVRFDLAEFLYQSQAWDRAAPHFLWLAQQTQRSPSPPEWKATVLLRQAEMLAHQQKWKEVEVYVSQIRNDFPQWSKVGEVDYLLARCRVSDANFDAARELLLPILTNPTSPKGLAARAGWMLGETFMMQRRYAEAQTAYARVLEIPNEEFWHAASSLQLGQCAELMQDIAAADEWYRKVREEHPNTPFATTANQRLERVADTNTKTSKRIGSGTKR